MTDAEAETAFKAIRWADTNGTPVCPSCGSVEAYEARRASGALRFRCKGCKKDFTVTSGTLFASHKLPLRGYLAAIAVFCNEVKGKSALAPSRDLSLSYKSAFVLLHKLREAMAEEMRGRVVGGEGKEAFLGQSRGPAQPNGISPSPKPSRFARSIQYFKGYLEKRRAKKAKQNPVDRAATSTARATWAIAILTAVTIGVGWSQYRIFDRQLTVMRGQLDAMEADQRPWLRPKIIEMEPLAITEKNISFGVTFEFINSGKSPATQIGHSADLHRAGKSLYSAYADLCMAAEMSGNDTIAPTIFPNENGNRRFTDLWSKPNVADFNTRFSGPYNPNPIFYVTPTVIGCIAYRATPESKFHHTRFAHAFDKKGADETAIIRILPGTQTINGADLRYSYSSFGRNDAD
jgi:transposase-like protein